MRKSISANQGLIFIIFLLMRAVRILGQPSSSSYCSSANITYSLWGDFGASGLLSAITACNGTYTAGDCATSGEVSDGLCTDGVRGLITGTLSESYPQNLGVLQNRQRLCVISKLGCDTQVNMQAYIIAGIVIGSVVGALCLCAIMVGVKTVVCKTRRVNGERRGGELTLRAQVVVDAVDVQPLLAVAANPPAPPDELDEEIPDEARGAAASARAAAEPEMAVGAGRRL